jgi:hypothetical protein
LEAHCGVQDKHPSIYWRSSAQFWNFVINLPIRTLRLNQPEINFDYLHELRRKARRIKYGLFGADRGKNPFIRSRFPIKYGKAKGRYGTGKPVVMFDTIRFGYM